MRHSHSRQDYLQSTIPAWEGSGRFGAKPRPHNFLDLLKKFDSWVYAACMYNARGLASQTLRLYARKPRSAQKSNFPTRNISNSRKDFLSGNDSIRPSKGVMTSMGHNADVEEVLEHPILSVLQNPTPFMSGYDLSVLRTINLQITGNCYMHPIYNQVDVPAELWNVPSQWVEIVPDRDTNMIGGFTYGRHPNVIEFGVSDLLHNKLPNPLDEFYGIGWVSAAADSAEMLKEMDNYEHTLFKNLARPDWGIFVNENLTTTQYERIEDQIKNKLKGNKSSGTPFIFEGGLDARPLQWTPRDLAFESGMQSKIENIAAISGVPVSMLKANDPNLASAREGNLSWLRNTIQPYCVSDEEYLNRTLVKLFGEFGESLFLAYDNPVPSDKQADSQLFVQEINSGIRTRNEARVELGLEPISGGDELLIPAGLIPLSQAGQQQGMGGMPPFMQQQQQQQQRQQPQRLPEIPKLEKEQVEPKGTDGLPKAGKSVVPEIVKSCARGEIPRDSAIAQCVIIGGLSLEDATKVVGSSGKKGATEAYFATQEEAEEYGKRLGIEGSHQMEKDGVMYWMPSATHKEWEDFSLGRLAKGEKAGFDESQRRNQDTGKWSDTGGAHETIVRDSSRGNKPIKEGEITGREASGLMEKLVEDGGFTYRPQEGHPTSGFSVSTNPELEAILPESFTDPKMRSNLRSRIRRFVKKNRKVFVENPKAYFGGWWDKENKKIYLDISTVVDTAKEAEQLSKTHKQEAYYDLNTLATIIVGAREDAKRKDPAKTG